MDVEGPVPVFASGPKMTKSTPEGAANLKIIPRLQLNPAVVLVIISHILNISTALCTFRNKNNVSLSNSIPISTYVVDCTIINL